MITKTPPKKREKIDPRSGPNGIIAQISRSQVRRSKVVSVTLPKLSWKDKHHE